MRIVETEQGQKVLVHYEEALDGLGTETEHLRYLLGLAARHVG